jgi:tetratricopeptide (TPR) repeat protein
MANPFFILTILIISGSACRSYKSPDLFVNKESERIFLIAQDLELKGKLDSAIIYFNMADAAAPNTAIILHERGLLKSHMQNHEEALKDLNRSIELTTDAELKQIRINNRGLTFLEMGKMAEACNDFKNAGKFGKERVSKYCN